MTTETILAAIAEVTGRTGIKPDQDLLESGIIDSFGILQLIMTLESRLGVKMGDDDLNAANFRTAERIAAMIVGKRPAD
jgi:D-alanine--poly(phosphoribitol) ligase subunit 2